jgi:flavin reductase (DIM6/NTAB) family NADH-FMN oxidoreductase RutF
MASRATSFVDAMATLPAGVAVVTTWTPQRDPCGTTVSAVCSLSLDPQLLVVCLGRGSETLRALEHDGTFTVNVLAHDQEALGRRFAAKGPGRFDGVGWTAEDGEPPVLDGAAAAVVCRVHALQDGGDHRVVVGRVDRTAVDEARHALAYYRRGFVRLAG